MTETYYLIPNSAGTAFLGNGYTPDGTLPKGAMVCTQAQASNFEAYAPDMSTTPPSIVSVPTSVLLAAAKTAQSALIKQGFANAVAAIPFTINGTSYVLDTAQTKQAAYMAIVVAANNAMNHPVLWAASTSVAQYAVQLVGSSYLFCTVAGTTGTTAPTPPTTFGTPVTDGGVNGGVTWELYGRTLEMSDGTHATFTVQELISIFQQVEVYIHYQKNQKLNLLAQIAAATTVSAVQAIVW